MKFLKSTLLMASAMFALSSYAQSEVDDTFVFVDKDGKEVPSGTTYTANIIEVVKGEEESYEQVVTGLSVKNTTDGKPALGGDFKLTAIDNGFFQTCFPEGCIPGSDQPTTFKLSEKIFEPNESVDLQTEWIPDGDGSCTATIQLKLFKPYKNKLGFQVFEELETEYPMPSLTIKFVKGTTGINDILTVDNTKVVGVYTVDGKRVSGMQKGLNIVKLSDGKTLKVIK